MPAITVDNPLVLPRLAPPAADGRRAALSPRSSPPTTTVEGAGFEVWRPFPGGIDTARSPIPSSCSTSSDRSSTRPNEPVGAPWHPHRGFETVTYVHRRRDRAPRLERRWRRHRRGRHAVDDRRRRHPPRRGADRGVPPQRRPVPRRAAVGEPPGAAEVHAAAVPGDHRRRPHAAVVARRRRARCGSSPATSTATPGRAPRTRRSPTPTPVSAPAPSSRSPWNPAFSALAYVLTGQRLRRSRAPSRRGPRARGVRAGRHDHRQRRRLAAGRTRPNLEVLLLGGLPIREPIAHYGPFLMNTREEIIDAVEDFQRRPHGDHPRDLGVKPSRRQRQANTGCS